MPKVYFNLISFLIYVYFSFFTFRFKVFKKSKVDRMLLWHGSRTTNFAGIISQGLKIAPPEAPVTGYMFGKGIYFADMVSKSANYCQTTRTNNTGLLMVSISKVMSSFLVMDRKSD